MWQDSLGSVSTLVEPPWTSAVVVMVTEPARPSAFSTGASSFSSRVPPSSSSCSEPCFCSSPAMSMFCAELRAAMVR